MDKFLVGALKTAFLERKRTEVVNWTTGLETQVTGLVVTLAGSPVLL